MDELVVDSAMALMSEAHSLFISKSRKKGNNLELYYRRRCKVIVEDLTLCVGDNKQLILNRPEEILND